MAISRPRRLAAVMVPLLLGGLVSVLAAAPARAAIGDVTVRDGGARFEVLSPTLIRMEYSGDGSFQDATTFNVLSRDFPTATFSTDVTADGFREIHTSALTLKYKQNSGPFTASNVSVQLAGTNVTAAPAFASYCAYGGACEAEAALLSGFTQTAYDHTGYTGTGFMAGWTTTGNAITHDVSAIPSAGTYKLQLRYANGTGSNKTLSTSINGSPGPTITFGATASWNDWATASVNISLRAGVNTVKIVENSGDSANVNLDSLAVTSTSAGYPGASNLAVTGYGVGPASYLGGWSRSLDNPAVLPVPEHPGILDRDGWYLLDDSRTSLLSSSHAVSDRPSHGTQPYQDGYLFGYGQNYKQGLSDLNALTGAADLLPESAYGVWFSRYGAYSSDYYKNTFLPPFRSNKVPLDWLVADTDWKSPNTWNGWNWNTSLFPNPQDFLDWTKSQGLQVSLNIHPTIAGNDPQFTTANSTGGGLTKDGSDYRFDWSNPAQMSAYLNLHQSFEKQGVREWWLDYCPSCGNSVATDPHIAPDNLINQAYTDDATSKGLRGFSFARIGGSAETGDNGAYPLGPWSERRNTMQFTGDTDATWQMLTYQVQFTTDEATAGLSNVSHDIGSFHGGHLADDMYARWVQFATFQPIDRLHSDHGDRLPWNYGTAANASATKFLQLRDALIPYTYSIARQANTTGVPMVRPLYLDYPTENGAYSTKNEYLYGPNVLVAPITSANDANGNASTTVWVPPGTWTDYFTGRSYTGPSTTTMTSSLAQMPVLIKAGGIMTTRTDYVDHVTQSPLTQLTVNVADGADGSFSLYQDAGEGSGYQSGQFTTSPISWSNANRTLTLAASTGSFSGAAGSRAYTLKLSNATAPTSITVDGQQLAASAWSYSAPTRTVTATTASLPVTSAHTLTLSGTGAGSATGPVRSGIAGKCLDVSGANSTNGTAIQLWTCNATTAQSWTAGTDGTLKVLGKCLDITAQATANLSPVEIWDCNGGANQLWEAYNGGYRNPVSGRCLDDPGASTLDGTKLIIYDCNSGPNQTWSQPGA